MCNTYFGSILLGFGVNLTAIVSTFLIFVLGVEYSPQKLQMSGKLLAVGHRFPPKGKKFGTLVRFGLFGMVMSDFHMPAHDLCMPCLTNYVPLPGVVLQTLVDFMWCGRFYVYVFHRRRRKCKCWSW